MSTWKILATSALTLISIGVSAQDHEWEVTGFFGLDSRSFWEDERFAEQDSSLNTSLRLQPELYWRSSDGRQRVSVVAFGRIDSQDDDRSHLDLREAYWGYEGDGWDLRAGISKVFWGVAESRHLVDIINQTDLVEDIDQEHKLGQPMVNVNLQRDFGRFELYVMPWFRERTFVGVDGRLRFPLPIDVDNPLYESGDRERHTDLALRYSHYIGDLDIGVHVFDGTSREPRFALSDDGSRFVPVYEQINQFGVDLQLTRDAWLWKFEGLRREARSGNFNAAVGGFEYTFYGVANRAADLGVLVEYLYDDRDPTAPPTPFDDDIFIGARLALNDSSDTSLLAGAVIDTDTHERFLNVEAERRFGDNLTLDLRLRAFSNAAPSSLLDGFAQDDYLQVSLSWYY
jgi:hypothetical protein